MPTVSDILNWLNEQTPFETQCDWDNSGLLVGDESASVERIGFALDLTNKTLAEAKKERIDLLVTHHPVLFSAQKNFLKGDPVFELAQSGIAAISTHTPFDQANGGVNDLLCELLDLQNVQTPHAQDGDFLRVATLETAVSAAEFAAFAAKRLHTTVRLGDAGKPVKTVAVCAGAAMDLAPFAKECGADLYLTGDLKHHELLDALSCGLSVAAAGHFETERPAVAVLCERMRAAFPMIETVLLKEENPIRFIG